jgi:hypothetical protein
MQTGFMAKMDWGRVDKENWDLQACKEGLPHVGTDEQRRKRPMTNQQLMYAEGLGGTKMAQYRTRVKAMNFRKET